MPSGLSITGAEVVAGTPRHRVGPTLSATLLCAAFAFVAVGCGSGEATVAVDDPGPTTSLELDEPVPGPGFDVDSEIAAMVDAGLPESVARCIVDESLEVFGEDRLLEFKEVVPEDGEAAQQDEIAARCLSAGASGY